MFLRPVVGVLAGWIVISAADLVREQLRPATVVDPSRFQSLFRNWPGLRIGVALSGGGYRAALFHAGVLEALERKGAVATNLSTVSGGSIIGSFYAVGGSPREFLRIVRDGQFHLRRELVRFPTLIRLACPGRAFDLLDLFPFCELSRLDVQASLLERHLLGRAGFPYDAVRPFLLVNTTDLLGGRIIGFSNSHVISTGNGESSVAEIDRRIRFPQRPRLSQIVAMSGGFPVAFPSAPLQFEILLDAQDYTHLAAMRSNVPSAKSVDSDLQGLLLLADGGVLDNSGMRQMYGFALHAFDANGRTATIPSAHPSIPPAALSIRRSQRDLDLGIAVGGEWNIDIAIASDGGKSAESERDLNWLEGVARAIDLASSGESFADIDKFPHSSIPHAEVSPHDLLEDIRESEMPSLAVHTRASFETWVYLRDQARLADLVSILPSNLKGPELLRASLEHAGGNVDVMEHWGNSVPVPGTIDFHPSDSILPELPEGLLRPIPQWDRDVTALDVWVQGGRCKDTEWESNFPGISGSCAGLRLGTTIAADIDRTLRVFRRTSTLEDQLSVDDAEAIFRLGQYLVALEWQVLRDKLNAACASSRDCRPAVSP